MSKYNKPVLIVLIILFLDQALKIWIKTHMYLGQEYNIFGKWFIIHFTENNGMAFGFQFGGETGKMLLSIFRIFAVIGIGFYIRYLIKNNAANGLVTCVPIILAGAMGNIIDSAFYGMIFNESYYQIATLFPPEGGYSSFLHGRVVDMFYFPILEGNFPTWFPFWGGEDFVFFRPVFNLADSAITLGVVLIFVFQKQFFQSEQSIEKKKKTATV